MAYGKGRRKGITKTAIEDALRAVRSKSGQEYELRDTEVGGLSIRVRKRAASWTLRCRVSGLQCTYTIAPVELLQDVARAREIARNGKGKAAGGEDPRPYFRACLASESDVEAEARVRRGKGVEWTWEEAVEKFLAAALKAKKRPDTITDYGQALRNPAARAHLSDRLLSTITADDARGVRDDLLAGGHRRQAVHTLGRIKQLLDWACDQKGSGVRENVAAGVKIGAFRKGRPGIEDAITHAV